jgi:uncharacterized protein
LSVTVRARVSISDAVRPDGGVDWRALGRAPLFVMAVLAPIYVLFNVIKGAWHVDFRMWVVTLMPMSPARWDAFFGYLIPFAIFFVAQGIIFSGSLRWRKGKAPLYTYYFRKTGRVFVGALMVTVFIVWSLAASGDFAVWPVIG